MGRGGQPYALTLRDISPDVDPVGRTYRVRMRLTAPDGEAALGRTVTVRLTTADAAPVAALPLAAVLNDGTGPRSGVFGGDRVERVPVEVVAVDGQVAEVRGAWRKATSSSALGPTRSTPPARCVWWKPRHAGKLTPMRNLNLSLWSVTNPAVTLFAILVALVAGALAYINLGRAEDPTFTIKTMVVQAVWPGATAEEMQNLVAEPIEKRMQELPELDYVRTFSRPGVTVLQVQLKDSERAGVQDVWYQIRKKVADLRPTLPQGLIGPFFNDEYGDVFSAIYMVTGEGLGRAELKAYAERLRTRLLAVEDAAKVALIGDVEERVYVEISHRQLATLGISPQVIFDAIGKQNAMTAAGAFQTDADAVQVRVSGDLGSLAALRDLPIAAGASVLRLGDIATITRGYEDPPAYLAFFNGQETVGVGVAMADGANVVHLGEVLAAEVEAFRADLPLGVEVTQASDQADIVDMRSRSSSTPSSRRW